MLFHLNAALDGHGLDFGILGSIWEVLDVFRDDYGLVLGSFLLS